MKYVLSTYVDTICGAVDDVKKLVKDTFNECTSILEFVNLFPDLFRELM